MTRDHEGPLIVAEDDEIKVIFQPGTSDFLLVTFGDIGVLANGLRFYADTPIKKAGISCLGFMAKSENWYPSINMNELIGFIRPYTENYQCIISYGHSMGAYAAIKYSNLIGMTHVIALGPQWSIDKIECGGFDPGWQFYFNAELHRNIGIKVGDCSGQTFVFSDPYSKLDYFHARKIQEVSAARFVAVPRVDHNIARTLAGAEIFSRLIDYCRNEDMGAIRRLVRENRRRNGVRIHKVARFAERRYPESFAERTAKALSEKTPRDFDIRYAGLAMKRLAKLGKLE